MRLNKNNCAEIEMKFLIEVLIGVIILVLMVTFISSYLKDDYSSKVSECSFFMNNVDGKPKYFGTNLSGITNNFVESVSMLCPSKDVEISENKLSSGADLMLNCNKIIGSGTDFFGANVESSSVCIHCGFVYVESDVNNFNNDIMEILSDEKYSKLYGNDYDLINSNEVFLKSDFFPNSLNKGEYYQVLGYAYKPEITSNIDSIKNSFSRFYGEFGNAAINYFISSGAVDGIYGVTFSKFENYGEFDLDKNVSFTSGEDLVIGCDKIIFPKVNYD